MERKPGLVMVERLDSTPCRLAVAILACFPQPSFMRITRLVTIDAPLAGIAELFRRLVTSIAWNGLVRVPQRKVRKAVIEGLPIELDNVGISSLVIGVTLGAIMSRGIRLTPVKSLTRRSIRSNVLVTRQA